MLNFKFQSLVTVIIRQRFRGFAPRLVEVGNQGEKIVKDGDGWYLAHRRGRVIDQVSSETNKQ